MQFFCTALSLSCVLAPELKHLYVLGQGCELAGDTMVASVTCPSLVSPFLVYLHEHVLAGLVITSETCVGGHFQGVYLDVWVEDGDSNMA